MDPFRALLLPVECCLQRGTVAGFAAGLALHESDGLAVDDVDGGKQFKYGQLVLAGHGVLSSYRRWSSSGADPVAPHSAAPRAFIWLVAGAYWAGGHLPGRVSR